MRIAVDGVGQKVGGFQYSDFGKTSSTGEVENIRYRYTGQEWDGEVEEYNYLAREYDPATGRFNSPDPAREGFSPYVYAGNNPINYADPDVYAKVRLVIYNQFDKRYYNRATGEATPAGKELFGLVREGKIILRSWQDIKTNNGLNFSEQEAANFNGRISLNAHSDIGKNSAWMKGTEEDPEEVFDLPISEFAGHLNKLETLREISLLVCQGGQSDGFLFNLKSKLSPRDNKITLQGYKGYLRMVDYKNTNSTVNNYGYVLMDRIELRQVDSSALSLPYSSRDLLTEGIETGFSDYDSFITKESILRLKI